MRTLIPVTKQALNDSALSSLGETTSTTVRKLTYHNLRMTCSWRLLRTLWMELLRAADGACDSRLLSRLL